MVRCVHGMFILGRTNTNECITAVTQVGVCFVPDPATGLPADLRGCCDVMRTMARNRCECNPTPTMLLGGSKYVMRSLSNQAALSTFTLVFASMFCR